MSREHDASVLYKGWFTDIYGTFAVRLKLESLVLITQWQIQKLQSEMIDSVRSLVCIFVQWAEFKTVVCYSEELVNSLLYSHG